MLGNLVSSRTRSLICRYHQFLSQHKHLPSYSQLDREQSISLESHWAQYHNKEEIPSTCNLGYKQKNCYCPRVPYQMLTKWVQTSNTTVQLPDTWQKSVGTTGTDSDSFLPNALHNETERERENRSQQKRRVTRFWIYQIAIEPSGSSIYSSAELKN